MTEKAEIGLQAGPTPILDARHAAAIRGETERWHVHFDGKPELECHVCGVNVSA